MSGQVQSVGIPSVFGQYGTQVVYKLANVLLGPATVINFNSGANATLENGVLTVEVEGGGGSVTVIDALNSTSTTDALSANQGMVLAEDITNAKAYADSLVVGLLDDYWLKSHKHKENALDAFISATTADGATLTHSIGSEPTMTGVSKDITSATWATVSSTHLVTITTAYEHNLTDNDSVVISGFNEADYNGPKKITVTSANTFTYTINASAYPTTPATGTGTFYKKPVLIRANEAFFTYPQGRSVLKPQAGSAYWQNGQNDLSLNFGLFFVEFVCNSNEFEIFYSRSGGGFKIFVNDYPLTTNRIKMTDVSYPQMLTKVTFATVAERHIRIEFDSLTRFMGVFAKNPVDIKKAYDLKRPKCLILADSFGEGTGAYDSRFGSFGYMLCKKMGWEFLDGSLGSTGITTSGVQPSGSKYIERLRSIYAVTKPDIVFVEGSVNDGGSITTTNAGELFDAISTLLPSAKIYAFGGLWINETIPQALLTSATNLKTAATLRGIKYIDGGIGLNEDSIWINANNKLCYYAGIGATATATLSGGAVNAVNIVNNGMGYDIHAPAPTVTFSGGGTVATAIANINHQVKDLIVLNGGSGYTSAPTVTIGNGATGAACRSGSVVSGVTVSDEGGGYLVPPTVSFSGGGGTGAAAVAVIEGGRVVRVDITSGGSGYTSDPTVTFSESDTIATATATIANGKVTGLTITSGGSFYKSCPRVKFSGGGTGSGGAEAVAFVCGVVSSVTVNNGGSGYETAPTVTVAHPHPAGASDSTHPKQTGHQMIAIRIAEQI